MATQKQIEALKIDKNVFELVEETEKDFKCCYRGACHQLGRLPIFNIFNEKLLFL